MVLGVRWMMGGCPRGPGLSPPRSAAQSSPCCPPFTLHLPPLCACSFPPRQSSQLASSEAPAHSTTRAVTDSSSSSPHSGSHLSDPPLRSCPPHRNPLPTSREQPTCQVRRRRHHPHHTARCRRSGPTEAAAATRCSTRTRYRRESGPAEPRSPQSGGTTQAHSRQGVSHWGRRCLDCDTPESGGRERRASCGSDGNLTL